MAKKQKLNHWSKKDNTYTTGTGQRLWAIHPIEKCEGRPCVIHNPSNHAMVEMPTFWRDDRGIMERTCPCGIGHPDPDSPWPRESAEWIHGCCMIHCIKPNE